MKGWVKITIGVVIVAILIATSFFIYDLFFVAYAPPPERQPFFVNCTYYIYPNGTFAVVNITQVIQLTDKKPILDYRFLWVPNHDMDPENITKSYYLDNDHDGLLSVGDQYVIVCKKAPSVVSLWYMDIGGGTLWDSEHGPYVWKDTI